MEGFTEEFEEGFMELLRRSHPHSRVAAKIVYNDYISDPCVYTLAATGSWPGRGSPSSGHEAHHTVALPLGQLNT